MTYTATDILEACGLDPAGAPRTVVLAATALELALKHEEPDMTLAVPQRVKGSPRRGLKYPPAYVVDRTRVELFIGVREWARLMSEELDLGVKLNVVEFRFAQPYYHAGGRWVAIETVMGNADEAANWWYRCTYPLGPRRGS